MIEANEVISDDDEEMMDKIMDSNTNEELIENLS